MGSESYDMGVIERALQMPQSNKNNLQEVLKCKEFYTKKNNEMESLLAQFGTLNTLPKSNSAKKDLLAIQEKFSCKDISWQSATMSSLAISRVLDAQNDCLSQIKLCSLYYARLNEELQEKKTFYEQDLKTVEKYVDENAIQNILNNIKANQVKFDIAKKKIEMLESNNSWLQTKNLNVSAVMSELQVSDRLKSERQQLTEDLKCYYGLDPDIFRAKQQLHERKVEYEKYN